MTQLLDVRERAALRWSPAESAVADAGGGAERFLQHLALVAEAAGGMKRIRELILQLAVRGRLCKPGSNGTAAFVQQLREHRARLKQSGVRIPVEVPIPADELPYEVPATWSWVRLGELGGVVGGGTPSKSNDAFWKGAIPWVSPKDMKRPLIGDAEDHISEAAVAGSAVKLIPQNSLLYVVRGMILAHSFPVAATTREVTVNQDMKALVLALPEMSPFVLRVMQALRPRVLALVERSSHGTCRLDSEAVERLPIALPPLAEQKRIVAKVDQLMALCDELEARQARKLETGARLTRSALEALTTAEGQGEFALAWRRIVENFDTIVDGAAQVAEVRAALVSLAVRGRLTSAHPDDAAARTVLGRLPTPEKGSPIGRLTDGNSGPFELKNGWAWTTLGRLVDPSRPISYGVLVPGPDVPGGVPFVRIQDLSVTAPPAVPAKAISPEVARQYSRTTLRGGEILLGVVGSIGKVGVAPATWAGAAIARAVCRVAPHADVDGRYLAWVIQSDLLQSFFLDSTRTLAQPTLNVGMIKAAPVPLPPLEEQRRIVARLAQLMTVCDELEAQFRNRDELASKAAEAIVQELVA